MTVALRFLEGLRSAGLPVSVREYLTLMEAMEADLAGRSVDGFYLLARAILVKDERNLDRFDQVFARIFEGLTAVSGEEPTADIPLDWLMALTEKVLTEEEKALIESLGGWDKLMETFRQRLDEQKGRHQGGNKWIGTGGTSPFGAYGYNPEGIRIGQDGSRNRRAVKVWDRREYRDLDGDVELGIRTIKLALRRLRRFAREGRAEELDLDGTIRETARQGWLDVRLRPERRNALKLVVLFDIGGSMDDHVRVCEELFSAARAEFKTMDYYYFHNCPYEHLWKNNQRRHEEKTPTQTLINRMPPDTRLILVGDATMSPYELSMPGGSVEHWNEEPGIVWLTRLTRAFPRHAWLNPEPEHRWRFTPSIGAVRQALENRMYPLTLAGLDAAVRDLGH